jgi:Right handed beta helix region
MNRSRFVLLLVIIATVATGSVAHGAAARTFYVSPTGDDRARGRTPGHAWRTVGRVDRARLGPGDVVLFKGGAAFADDTLTPSRSGAAGQPITFGSYGRGRATLDNGHGAVWLSGRDYLTFDNLRLTTRGGGAVIFAGSEAPSSHITLENSVLRDSNFAAINQPGARDQSWLIRNNTITHVGDSALILAGANDVVRGNTIRDVGWNPDLDYGKHGIYAKGPDLLVADNRISGFPNGSGISLRSRDARVIGNTIRHGGTGISFYREDSTIGTSAIIGNRILDVSYAAFYYDNAGGENFILEKNFFMMTGGTVLDFAGRPSEKIVVSNNHLAGPFEFAIAAPQLAGACSEFKNRFAGNPRFAWERQSLNYVQYRTESGQASGDRIDTR